jgi:hypothetical protein
VVAILKKFLCFVGIHGSIEIYGTINKKVYGVCTECWKVGIFDDYGRFVIENAKF